MPLAIIVSTLFEIVRILLALPFWCAVLQIASASFAVSRLDYVLPLQVGVRNPIHHVVAAGDQRVIVGFAVGHGQERGLYREITSGSGGPLRIRIPATPHNTWMIERASDALLATGNEWWYATQDEQDGASAVTFVKSDGSRSTYLKPPELTSDVFAQSRSWQMALVPGEKARVLLFDYGPEQTMVLEIDATGAKRSWQLPPAISKHVGNVIAEQLPDGRVALFDSHNGLSMYLLADEGRFESIPLRNIEIDAFDGVLDPAGRIAIAAARHDTGVIEAAVIDPAHPDPTEWRPLHHQTHVVGPMRVVATPGGFAAAWMNNPDARRVEAADIDRNGRWGPVVEVGRPFSRDEPFLDLQSRQDELLFWWDDGSHLFERRLPASLKGYAAMTELRCGDSKQTGDASRDDSLMRLFRDFWDLSALQ
jgi:hypothetical protein